MLEMNKAEVKRYIEENITVLSMIISSSHSYISYLFQVLHNSRVFLLLNALYTNKEKYFRARSFCVEKDTKRDTERESNIHKFHLIRFLCSIRICWLHDTNYQGLTLISKRTTERHVKWTQSYKHLVIGRWKPSGPMCLLGWNKLIIPLRFCSFLAANLSTDFYQVSSAVQWSDLPIRGPDW